MTTNSGASAVSSGQLRSAALRESTSLELPLRSVGKYRILSELGRGGMANVFLAVAQGVGGVNKLVVLKALLPELSSQPDALTMFLDEARLAARLNHPNVVQTYEVGTEGDRHVIVMEYLDGQSLSSVLKRLEISGEPMPLAMHLRVISAALEGLHYAHELTDYDGSAIRLVHRDVSPQNLFLTYDGQVKVLDFGIAKAATSSNDTATGIIKGKIAYMAPEQMIGDALDRRADVYSVGCMLWAAAVGQKLWRDTPDVHVMRRVINADVPTPQSVNANCSDELNRIVLKAMSWDANERYATALEVQSDLDQYLETLSERTKPKQTGAFVSALFADTRAELKAVIERQLALVTELQGPEDSSSLKLRGTNPEIWEPPSGREARRLAAAAEPKPRRKLWPWLLAVPLVLGVVLWLVSRFSAHEASPPIVAGTPASTTPAAVASTTVRLHAEPPSARLFLDEQPLAENPIALPLALDGSPRRLRAEAAGYDNGEVTFVATRDRQVELALKPSVATPASASAAPPSSGKPRAGATAGKARPPGSTTKAPTTSNSKPSCDSPFFVDSNGIRKLRPECI